MDTPEIRRRTMQAVKSKDTAPERAVRRLLSARGYRYRLHRKELPGCPDLVFSGRRKVIFIHGCFWHGHDCARGSRVPVNNRDYWVRKVARNRERDDSALAALAEMEWDVMVVWECELKDDDRLLRRLTRFLG
jgi:DNA mismatch endonuclease (patch repair protein)